MSSHPGFLAAPADTWPGFQVIAMDGPPGRCVDGSRRAGVIVHARCDAFASRIPASVRRRSFVRFALSAGRAGLMLLCVQNDVKN